MSKRHFFITVAAVLSLTTSLAVAQTAAPKSSEKAAASADMKADAKDVTASPKAPRLTIIEAVRDYGTVAKGEKLDWSFLVKNTGDADLEIIAARPGCGCTVADFDKVIKPGQTGKVTAHVDTTNFAGPISKSITVETNDPSTPTAQLTIHAVVKPYVEAYPAGFVRYNILQGDRATQSLTLYSEEDEPFLITKVEVPGDWVKVDYKKIEDPAQLAQNVGKQGQAQYRMNITVGAADAKIGPIAEKIHIITNSKHQPDYFVSVSGVIRPTFRVEPAGVNFGEVSANDTAATRTVLLHSNDLTAPERFSVTKAESSVPGVTAAVKPAAAKGDYEVTLQVAKNARLGDLDGSVKIYTNDKITPVVTVPIKATIKKAGVEAAKPSK